MADISLVKRNIGRMIDQGAPESDIDAYISSEGVTTEMLQAPSQPQQRGVVDQLLGQTGPRVQMWPERLARDVYKTAVSGVTLPGDVAAGKFNPQPSDPGQLTEEDAFRQNQAKDELARRSLDLAAVATPINPAARAGDKLIPGMARNLEQQKPPVPTATELKTAGAADIEAAKNSGLELKASALGDLSFRIQQELFKRGIHPVDAPATYAKLKGLEDAPAGSFATAANLQSLRESFGHTAQNFNPQAAKDQLAATLAIRGLDESLPKVNPADVLAGAPAATARQFERGRGNYAAAQRSNDITGELDRGVTGILEKAELGAQVANSGRNIDNKIRQSIASLLKQEKDISGLTGDEIAALLKSAEGSKLRNAARSIGNKLGGGGGLGQTLIAALGGGAGAAAGMPSGPAGAMIGATLGAAVPASIGSGSRGLANLLAKRSLRDVDEMLRKRSPLYEEAITNAPMTPVDPRTRAALIRALLASQQQQ
jgi:hypothetical protein